MSGQHPVDNNLDSDNYGESIQPAPNNVPAVSDITNDHNDVVPDVEMKTTSSSQSKKEPEKKPTENEDGESIQSASSNATTVSGNTSNNNDEVPEDEMGTSSSSSSKKGPEKKQTKNEDNRKRPAEDGESPAKKGRNPKETTETNYAVTENIPSTSTDELNDTQPPIGKRLRSADGESIQSAPNNAPAVSDNTSDHNDDVPEDEMETSSSSKSKKGSEKKQKKNKKIRKRPAEDGESPAKKGRGSNKTTEQNDTGTKDIPSTSTDGLSTTQPIRTLPERAAKNNSQYAQLDQGASTSAADSTTTNRRKGRMPKTQKSNEPNEDGEVVTMEKRTAEQDEMVRKQNTWYAYSQMRQALKTFDPKEHKQYERVFKMLDSYKEPELPSCALPMNAKHPDNKDYRALESFLFESVAPATTTLNKVWDINGKDMKECPDLLLTGPIHVDVRRISGEEVLKLAARYRTGGQNWIYDSSHVVAFPNSPALCGFREKKFFEENGFTEPESGKEHERKRLPVAVFNAAEKGFNEKLLAQYVSSCSICVVENIGVARNIYDGVFSLESLLPNVGEETEVDTILQIPEDSESNNQKLYNNRVDEEPLVGWKMESVEKKCTFEEVVNSHKRSGAYSREACRRLLDEPYEVEYIVENLIKQLCAVQIKPTDDKYKVPPNALLSCFLTNMDLPPPVLQKIGPEIEKFPDCFKISSNSNLLKLVKGDLPGIKTPQIYGKVTGGKTGGHSENGGAASINYNAGKEAVIWYSINFEYVGAFEKLLMLRKHTFYTTRVWPSEAELAAEGIIVSKFVQNPGALVFVGPGTYHWVYTEGYTVNVSWNIMPKTMHQLAILAIFHDHSLLEPTPFWIPIESIIWEMAKEKMKLDLEAFMVVKNMLCRSLAHCKFEIDIAINRKLKIVDDIPKEVDEIEKVCQGEDCPAKALFNLFAIRKEKEGLNAYCVNCAAKTDTVYIVHNLTELSTLYDNFKEE